MALKNFSLPPDTRTVGTGDPPADMNAVIDAVTAMGAALNVLSTAYAGGADPTGTNDSSPAIQAAITAALTQASSQGDDLAALVPTVYIPFGNYKISTPLNFAAASTAACRITGTWGSRLFSASGPVFDFQSVYLQGLEIDHLTIDAAGGHCFTNANLKWSWLHHLYLNQNSPGFSVWDQTQGADNQLQNTAFTDIRFFVFPDPVSNVRTVPGWNIQDPRGDAFAEVWFTRVEGWNGANAGGYLDTTQYLFCGACTHATVAYASTITFRDCSWHDCLGGAAWIQSGSHVVFDGCSVYDVFQRTSPGTMTLGNDLFKVSTYSGGSPTRGVELRGYTRSQGIAPSSSHDFSCSADTTDIYINGMTPTYFSNTGWDGSVNLNGAKTAVLVACDPVLTVTSPGSDTIIIGNGQITVGGTSQLTYDQLVSTLTPSAWWKLADAAASSTAADSSGNGWTGTVTSVTFGQAGPVVSTPADTAGLFASSSVITSSFAPSGQSAFSICAWVNMNGATPGASYSIAATDNTTSTNNGFNFKLNFTSSAWYPQLYVGNGAANTNGESAVGTFPLAASGWQFIVATFAAGAQAVKIYVNAVATGHSGTLTGTMAAGATNLSIGFNSAVAGSHFAGDIAQVAFFPAALTAGQVTSLYNAGLATIVTSVTAGDASVVVGGSPAAPTLKAGPAMPQGVDVTAAGKGLAVAEGSNAKQGTATLSAGTVTVSNTSVTANSRIFLTSNTDGGTPGWLRVSARSAGTSFTITSSSATDTSTVAYEIFEPG